MITVINIANLLIHSWTTPVVLWTAAGTLLALDAFALLSKKWLKVIAISLISFLFLVAFAKTLLQFEVWRQNPLSRNLLADFNPENANYFSFYVLYRFFMYPIFTVLSSLGFGLALHFIEKFSKSRLVSGEDAWLGAIAVLIVGWPNVLLLITLTLLTMAFFSLVSRVVPALRFLKRMPIAPFLYLFLIILLLFGTRLIYLFNLGVIKV